MPVADAAATTRLCFSIFLIPSGKKETRDDIFFRISRGSKERYLFLTKKNKTNENNYSSCFYVLRF